MGLSAVFCQGTALRTSAEGVYSLRHLENSSWTVLPNAFRLVPAGDQQSDDAQEHRVHEPRVTEHFSSGQGGLNGW